MDRLLHFFELLHQFQQVKRATLVRGEDRKENDFEHSYQLAMVAWYLVNSEKLPFNLERVIQYALVHDLVEVYADDTPTYGADLEEKAKREQAAAIQLQQKLPDFRDLHSLIHNYENQTDAESKFVYALDKLLPILNNYLDGGRNWKENGITLEMLIAHKTERIAISPYIKKYYDVLLEKLRASQSSLFAPPQN